MATSKPISTISYNSFPFLHERLNQLMESGKISAWFYILHNGESKQDDEAAGKDHKHLLLIPNKCVDLNELGRLFTEFLSYDPTHPLKCLPFRTAKLSDWFLYAVHDPDYLSSKGMEKTYHYDVCDIVASDDDYLHSLWVEARQTLRNDPVLRMKRAVNHGLSFGSLVNAGAFSIQQIRNAELYYSFLENYHGEDRHSIFFDNGLIIYPNGDIKDPDQPFDLLVGSGQLEVY